MHERVVVSWSGGKDAMLALHELRAGEHEVAGLLTNVRQRDGRASVHGVRGELLAAQAASLGLPLHTAALPAAPSNAEYLRIMGGALELLREAGATAVAFGDLFLDDVRRFREEQVRTAGLRALFPLWGRDTTDLANEFISLGYGAVLVCVDGEALPREFAGREYDESLLARLPRGADPCGENGEFHTFVYEGPHFAEPIRFARGETALRERRFWMTELIPEPPGKL